MIIWIVLAILLILAFIFIRFEHHGKKIRLILIIIVCLLLYFSLTAIFNSGQVDPTSPSGIIKGIYAYIGWLGKSAVNLWDVGKEMSGKVIDAVSINNSK